MPFYSQYTCYCLIGKPHLQLPPSPNFLSYKQSLQEYCELKSLALPVYSNKIPVHSNQQTDTRTVRVVSFGDTKAYYSFSAELPSSDCSDADERTAFVALQQLQYIPSNKVYQRVAGESRWN